MKFKVFDTLLLGFFGAILILSSYFLFAERSHETIVETKIIGEVEKSSNSVKKKQLNAINWLEVDKGNALIEDDYIFTGDNSTANLKFIDNNRITLSPNSLVHLKNFKDFPKLRLESGQIHAKTDDKLEIDLDGKNQRIIANGGEIILMKKNSAFNLQVTSGDVVFRDGKKSKKIQANQSLQINDASLKLEKNNFRIKRILIEDKDILVYWEDSADVKGHYSVLFLRDDLNTVIRELSTSKSYIISEDDKSFSFIKVVNMNNMKSTPPRRVIRTLSHDENRLANTAEMNKGENDSKESLIETFKDFILMPLREILDNDKKREVLKRKHN